MQGAAQLFVSDERLSGADELQRRAQLVSFADRIDMTRRAFERSSRPHSGGAGMPYFFYCMKDIALRRYVEDYVLAHGSMPTARVRLGHRPVDTDPGISWFDVDFDALTALVVSACEPLPLPKRYRLPRHERELFFEQKIMALVDAFDDSFVVERGGCHWDRWSLISFLQHYVTDYERLPRGKFRIDPGVIPLSFLRYDMGLVDFDALRQAAGVTDEAI
jgi:hypothetical protein